MALVKAQTVTYLDLRNIWETELTGSVLDAGSRQASGLTGVRVKVIGQSVASATTSDTGTYRLMKVSVVGNHPLELETHASVGYPHRYRVTPKRGQIQTLFRFSEKQIERWLGQLRGGLSPASGLLLAAVPELSSVTEQTQAAASPFVTPWNDSAVLSPETYTLGAQDELLVHQPLEQESPRFLALQLPEGGNRAALEDQRGVEIWSQMVIASPGVVNVIAPQ
jgi:hypothetical protein